VEVTSQADRLAEDITVQQIQQFIAHRAPQIDSRIVGRPLWLSDFRINCRMVDRMHDGRVFLAGDAAHIHSPTGGQGITTGMQDAANLAWKLARVARGAPSTLLDTYDEERLPHAEEVLRETDRTTTILFAPSRVLRLLRDKIVLPVLRNPWFQRRMFGKFSQLHVHYRQSSLSRERRRGWWQSRGVIRAGDRAPDVAFTDLRSDAKTTLFRLMETLRPIVLFNGIADSHQWCDQLELVDIDAYAVTLTPSVRAGHPRLLFDHTGDFAGLYGLRSAFILLIRPDGHVGLVQMPPDSVHLLTYLSLICDPIRLQRAFADRPTDWSTVDGR
jgi:hypothetical protein